MQRNYYLESDLYVPQKIVDKFNQMTISIIENGLHQFINSMEIFYRQLYSGAATNGKRHQFDFEPITFDEFYYVLITYFKHLIGILLVFVCEVTWFHIQKCWRNFHERRTQITNEILREILLK